MKENQKGSSFVLVLLVIVVVAILVLVGWYVSSRRSSAGKSGVDIEVVTGEGGMPPDTSLGQLLAGEQFTVVLTEPFSSLENWRASRVIQEVSTTTGKASINITAGKYGVYYTYKGQKTLYGDLTLENPRNDIQRDKQGPWYIKVNKLQRTKLRFSINPLPS
jgi:hypothetical protein